MLTESQKTILKYIFSPYELRKGNHVMVNNVIHKIENTGAKFCKTKWIFSKKEFTFSKYKDLNPIRLNNAKLKDWGFKLSSKNCYTHPKLNFNLILDEDYSFEIIHGDHPNVTIATGTYLHELQNIFYYLTKNELKNKKLC